VSETDVDERPERPDERREPPDELTRYVASMRRQRIWYLAVIAVLAVIALAVALVVWSSGEITHVHLHTAKSAPPSVPIGTPPATPAARWQNQDRTAIGAPFTAGTVVTYSAHTVTGRNALTGAADWTYTRSDRTVCEVAQVQDKTIAIYAVDGNCAEVSTFETGTGKRAWTRTLDENGLTVNGHPAIIATDDTLYVWGADYVYAIDPGSAYDRWTYPPGDGCRFTAVVPGTAGVLMSEHCAAGDQLLLRDRVAGIDDKQQDDDKKNQVLWRQKNVSTIPVAADSIVAAIDPTTRQLVTYDSAKGTRLAQTSLTPAPTATTPILHTVAGQNELIWIDGTVYAVSSGGTQQWTATASALPTVSSSDSTTAASDLVGSSILVPTSSGVAALDGTTGRITTQYPVPPPAPDSRVYALGNGFLVAGSSTAYYA